MHPYHSKLSPHRRERGQALVEYALIMVLIGLTFGVGLAATAPVVGGVFDRIVGDVLRQTEIADEDAPGREDFWGTVTQVAISTSSFSSGLATNTPAAATDVPTAGPSPTFTATYTETPISPTPTHTPTATPRDVRFTAPFRDTADNPNWWRIDSNLNLNGTPWTVNVYNGTNPTGTSLGSATGIQTIDIEGEFFEDVPTTNFSARLSREVEIFNNAQPIAIRLLADDGVRVFIEGTPLTLVDGNGNTNSWVSQGAPVLWTGTITLPVGEHDIVVEYFNGTGTPRLKVDIVGSGANPDDGAVTAGQPFVCNWGIEADENDANTESNLFEDYVGGVSASNTLCYLEWRGMVVIPDTMTRPELVFWDVWDLPSGTQAWVEVAEYVSNDITANPLVPNRASMNWQRVNLTHSTGGTANYNWTRNVIDLNPLMVGFTNPSPKYLAFRFVMQTSTVNSTTKWQIDDVEFRDGTSTLITADRLWTFNTTGERLDFIASGGRSNPGQESGWGLVTNNRFGSGGLAWHDSVDTAVDDPDHVSGNGPNGSSGFTRYKRHSDSPNSDALNAVRVHSLEFNGFINLTTVPNPDSFGNTGQPMLSFYHGFHLGSRTGWEVQYTTDPYSVSPANWQPLPGGVIRSVTANGEVISPALQELVVPLSGLPGNPPQIRIRFALLVHANADPRDGVWIDQIRLGREEAPRWLNYPFFDNALGSAPQLFWTYSGLWEPSNLNGYTGATNTPSGPQLSYASSPRSDYSNNQSTYMTMRWPVDLYNDTPSKRVIEDADGGIILTNTQSTPANSPELTFYHTRDIDNTDRFQVEWKRASESAWRPLWTYRRNMATDPSSPNERTARNDAWEFTRVSLYPVLRQFQTDGNGAPGVGTGNALRDDDIMIRFALIADGSNNARGVFVDDIQIRDRSNQVFKLWPGNQNRNDPSNGQSLGVGNGPSFGADPDFVTTGQGWRDVFRLGGDWNSISFASRGGTLSFHDSPINGQEIAPTGFRNNATGQADFGNNEWRTREESFSVLEMEPIFDLRGVRADDEAPMLTFWSRYHLGQDDYFRVQVSVEDTRAETTINNSMNGRCANLSIGLLQCYEQERGWSPWTTIWSRGNNGGAESSYGWQQMRVDLSPYAYQTAGNVQGKRIRIRFVSDALDRNNNRDGIYIDAIRVEHRLPYPQTTFINEAIFEDRSRNLNNWTAEGLWGLDVAVFQGGGGGPVSLGIWDVRWWDCNSCANLDPGRNFLVGTDLFLDNPTPAAGDRSQLVTAINYRFFGGSPISGWSRTDRLVMRATIDTPVVGGTDFPGGARSFSTRADDGVRLKVEELVGGVPQVDATTEWNVINRWTNSSEVGDQNSFTFVAGRRYRITLEYFENSGDGVITLSITDGRFSFSDSPKPSAGPVPDVRPIPYANTALVLRNVLDLTNMTEPSMVILEYQTKYRLDGNSTARLEVSTNGGFTWTQNNLQQSPPPAFSAYNFSFSSPNISNGNFGVDNPGLDPWQIRTNNLTAYKGQFVMIRFRLDRQNTNCVRRENCNGDQAENNPSLALADAYYNGWWITPVRVGKFEP